MANNKKGTDTSEVKEAHDENLKKKVMIGAAWMVSARWGIGLLGLISTVILARLLKPEDFGLVAMAAVFTGIIVALSQMETDIGLIRLKDIEDDHFNTAWTISLLAGLTAAGGIILLAPIAANYYNEQKVSEILTLIAVAPVISSLANPKTALFRKDFNFNKEFQYLILTKLLTISVTIPLAFILMDYRVLVYGIIVRAIFQVIIGYILLPFLPRFSLRKRRELLSFSMWIMIRNVSVTAMDRIEQLIIGANFGSQRTAYYHMGNEIGRMISGEIALPVGRALLPAMSAAQNSQERMKRGLLMTLAAVSIALPFGFGLASLAPEFISVILGDKWLPAKEVLEILSISASFAALAASFNPIIMVNGNVKHVALTWVAASIAMLVGTQLLIVYDSLALVAIVKASLQFLLFFVFMYLAMFQWPSEMRKALHIVSRPLGASIIMSMAVKSGQLYFELPAVIALLVWPVIGALVFATVLMGFWTMIGRPFGLECYIQQACIKLYHKVKTVGHL